MEHNLACLKRTATDCKLEQTPGNILSGNVVVVGNQSANVATKLPLHPVPLRHVLQDVIIQLDKIVSRTHLSNYG